MSKGLAGLLAPFAVASSPDRARAREVERDRELLHRAAGGDMGALRSLYKRHAGRALAVAQRILKDQTDAEDVVQETFLELWRRAAQYDHARGSAPAWIVTIARSRAIDRLRAAGSAARAVDGAADAGARPPPPEPEPAEAAERNAERERVGRALSELPAEQRQTIELAYFEGLSQREISLRTGSPLGTVKMRVKLAIAKLARLLKEDA
jgi:RNA polymerase sigma-70 factor, ECF subfamily